MAVKSSAKPCAPQGVCDPDDAEVQAPDCQWTYPPPAPTATSAPPTSTPQPGYTWCGDCANNTCSYVNINSCFDSDPSDGSCDNAELCGNNAPTSTPPPGPTNIPTSTPTPTVGPWMKVRNTSIAGNTALNNVLPSSITAFDSDDEANQPYLIIEGDGGGSTSFGDPGIVTATSISTGTGNVSITNWKIAGYDKQENLSYSMFLEYVKSRKQYKSITNISEITADGIYTYTGNLTLPNASIFDNKKVLLIVTGTLTIQDNINNPKTFIPNAGTAALNANHIVIDSNMSAVTAILLGNIVETGNSNIPLKIKGNIVARTTQLVNQRANPDNSKPSLFIVFEPKLYLDLLPYLSTSMYEWRQIQ